MDLVFFGIQGCGKGTQAKKLAAEHGYYIFEAGGELRKIKASGSKLGETVKSYMDQGNLVPLEIIMQVVKEAILAQPADQKIIFDGIPRDADQMQSFNTIMQEVGRDFRCVEIVVDEDEAVQRILGRAEKEGRADDADTEVIMRRIGVFKEKTRPVIETYRSEGRVTDVNGDGSIEEVYVRLREALGL